MLQCKIQNSIRWHQNDRGIAYIFQLKQELLFFRIACVILEWKCLLSVFRQTSGFKLRSYEPSISLDSHQPSVTCEPLSLRKNVVGYFCFIISLNTRKNLFLIKKGIFLFTFFTHSFCNWIAIFKRHFGFEKKHYAYFLVISCM